MGLECVCVFVCLCFAGGGWWQCQLARLFFCDFTGHALHELLFLKRQTVAQERRNLCAEVRRDCLS